MAKQKTALDDDRYYQFCAEYQDNLKLFAERLIEADHGHKLTWQQEKIIDAIEPQGAFVSVSSGHGCFGLGTEIMLSTGKVVPVEDIKPGDRLMGDDGGIRNVLRLCRGSEAMYRFTYEDGTGHTFNESHIICLTGIKGDRLTVTVREWLEWGETKKRSYACRRRDPENGFFKRLTISEVNPLGEGDYYGFELDGNNQFLGGDFTVLHNTGKSDATGIIALHFVICHPESLVMLTANNIDQVLNVIFAYLKKHWRNLCKLEPWLEQYFIITDKFFYAKGFKREWQIFGKTASPGKEEGLAGLHNKNYLIICDEASALEKKAYTTIVGGLTEGNNKLLLISQYTRPSGAFADSQTIMAKQGPDDERGIFTAIQLNSELSPLVTTKWIRDRRVEYGGADDPEYGIRVLGICPDNVAGFLISRSLAASGYDNKIKHVDDWGYLGAVDVATSGLRDKTEVTIAKVSGRHSNRRVETVFRWTAPVGMTGTQVAYELEQLGMAYQNITWVIDAGGYGATTCEEAERIGLIVKRVYWGNQVHSEKLKKRFFNQRAYANVMVRDALTTKRLMLFSPTRKDRDTTLDQMSKLPYEFNGDQRWQMLSKKIMREKHGIKSPDIPDTYAFFWLAEPIPAGEDITGEEDEDPFENALGNALNA